MIDQFIKDKRAYFTPKTYGIEGLTINGFDVDSIFVAGSNMASPENIPTTTFDLFIFHVKRSFLSAVFMTVGYKKYGVQFENTPLVQNDTNLTVSQIENVSNIDEIVPTPDVIPWYVTVPPSSIIIILLYVYSVIKIIITANVNFVRKLGRVEINIPFWTKRSESGTMFMSDPSVAKSVALVLRNTPFIVHPPPLLAEQSDMINSEGFKKEKQKSYGILSEYNKKKNAHQVADFKRMLLDATELVYTASFACLDRLIIYDSEGTLNQNIDILAKSVKKKFEISRIGSTLSIPDVRFTFPSNKKQINLFDGQIEVKTMKSNRISSYPKFPKGLLQTKFLEVVVLEKTNSKPYIATVLRQVCSMIDQGLIKPHELECTMAAIYTESYIYPPVQLVITSGLLSSLEGIPPPLITGSYV